MAGMQDYGADEILFSLNLVILKQSIPFCYICHDGNRTHEESEKQYARTVQPRQSARNANQGDKLNVR